MISEHILCVCSAIVISGCTVGPDYKTPLIDVPTTWSSKQSGGQNSARLMNWWKQFNDPLLNDLIVRAVANNLDVATAKAKIREARASSLVTSSTLADTVSSSDSATYGKTSGSPETYTQFKLGFDSSWELDLFGANHRASEASEYAIQASEDDLQSTLVTLLGDVASYYIDARGYQARIWLARRTANSQQKTAELTKLKFSAGGAAKSDVAKAAAQASSTEANVPNYESALATDFHRLSILIGEPPSALVTKLKTFRSIPASSRQLTAGIPSDVLNNRPDVRAAERRLAQATAKIGQAEAARYPSVSLTGSIATSAVNIGDLAKASSIGWSLGPSASIPIFNGGKLKASVVVTQAQRDQSFLAFRSTILTALEDVENALVSVSNERKRLSLLEDTTKNYGQASSLSRVLYDNGATGFLDVLDAERSFYSAEDSLIQSRVAVAKDFVALAKSLGGGWPGAIDSLTPEIVDADMVPRLRKAQ